MSKKNDRGVIVLSALEEDLLTLLLNGKPTYGLEILELLNKARCKQGISELRIGSLYPTLKRMEEQNLISGDFKEEVAEFTRRKYYKITNDGVIAISRTRAYRSLLAKEAGNELIPERDYQTSF